MRAANAVSLYLRKNLFLALATLLLLPATGAGAVPPFAVETDGGETITVTTLDDVVDFSGSRQVNDLPGPDGLVSFREAVTAVNNTAGPQTIEFAIPPSTFWLVPGVGLLRLEDGIFQLTDPGTTIDFSSQTRNMGDTNPDGPEIGINGLEPNGLGAAAIYMSGDDSVIKGLGEVHARGYAIRVVGNRNRIIGCQIGRPTYAAVEISGSGSLIPRDNVVGGTGAGEGNILGGLRIDGPADSNVVIGNTLLTNVEVRGATWNGVFVRNTRIGGPTAAERNIIAKSGHFGEEGLPIGSQITVLDADNTLIEGNYIGTTADGMAAASPQVGPDGVLVRDARGTTIRDNLIAGLRVVGRNHYAGQVFGRAVHVNAINDHSHDTVIERNTIGLAADRTTPIETYSGIIVDPVTGNYRSLGTRIASNHIASVETTGILVTKTETGVTITANSIHDCGDLGIDLSATAKADGPTANDAGDNDSGGNNLQNFPVLTSATTSGSTVVVQGTLDSSPSSAFTIEFFSSPQCDPTGFGEGATFLGATTVTTDGTGHATFSVTLQATVAPGAKATATATRLSTGDTSEFSACRDVTATAPPASTTLRVSAIDLSAVTQERTVNVTGHVVVRDAADFGVSGVVVRATWTRPDGTTATEQATTAAKGVATFAATGGLGTYTLTVTNITGANATFDPGKSELTKSITPSEGSRKMPIRPIRH